MKGNPMAPEPALSARPLPGSRTPAPRFDAVIIIFGAAVRPDGTPSPTLSHRTGAAAKFGARFAHPLFIPTGAKGRHGEAEAVVMANQLHQDGFPDAAILIEETGTDTLSSVRAVRRLLASTNPHCPVYVATSFYHVPRCLLLLRLAGVMASACPQRPVAASTGFWQRWFWRLREGLALPYDVLLMLWLRASGRT